MAGEPSTEAGRRLLAQAGRLHILADDFAVSIRAIEDEARSAGYQACVGDYGFDAAQERSARAAITAAIADLRGRHVKVDVTETEVRDWENYNYRFIADRPCPECLICQERWPCPDALLADRLEEVMGV